MSTLTLLGFRDSSERYTFDRESGAWSVETASATKDATGSAVGWGDVRRVDLWQGDRVFIGLYTDRRTVLLRVGTDEFDLCRPGVRSLRKGLGPFIKQFSVRSEGEVLFTARYWWADLHEWPDDDVLDIFYYIPKHISTPEKLKWFVDFWSLRQDGLPIVEAAKKLGAFRAPS